MDKLDALLHERNYEAPSENLAERITTAARFRAQEQPAANDNMRRRIMATAAMVAIAVSAALIWQGNTPSSQSLEVAQNAEATDERKSYLEWAEEEAFDAYDDYNEWDI